ncbi:MAG: hypothetical protein M3384_17280 [Acidobacteriota bacterium]|nr:hypothetical protein [Acidobacteriota bacterium]
MDLFNGIDASSMALLTFAVIGIVRAYESLIDGDYRTAGKIAVAGFVSKRGVCETLTFSIRTVKKRLVYFLTPKFTWLTLN